MVLSLFLAIAIASCTYALGVFVPLYSRPDNNCTNWSPISSAISTNSNTSFYIVIDTSNIFESEAALQQYDLCVPSLRPPINTNTIVLGYVDTQITPSQIYDKIDTYAGFDSSFRPTGILLGRTNASSATEYRPYIAYAKEKGLAFIVLGSFTPPDPDYYILGDLVITYDNLYDPFTIASLKVSSSTPAIQQVVLLNKAPSNCSYSAKLSELAKAGVAAVYITEGEDSGRVPNIFPEFVYEVASAKVYKSADTQDKGSSSQIIAIVGGVLGGVVVVLVLLLYVMWRRQRRHAPHDFAINPFRSLQPQTLVRQLKRIPGCTGQDTSDERAGLMQQANLLPVTSGQPSRSRRFKIIEYLSPSEARRAYGRNRENPPNYTAPPIVLS